MAPSARSAWLSPVPAGPNDRHRDAMERGLRPVLSLEGLVPGDDRDAALRQTPEQRRAPALAVEHQRQGRLAWIRCGEIRRVRRQHAERLQLGDDLRLQCFHHLRIERLVQAEQRAAVQRVDPVRDAGRQTQLLPGDKVLGQIALAAGIHLDMAIHRQRRASGGIRRHPLSRQSILPGGDRARAAGEQAKLAAKGLHLRAAIQPEQNAPLARSLHAQALGVANPPERQKGDKQQHAGDAVEAVRKPKQPTCGAKQTLLQQHRQPRQHPATRHRLRRLGKLRLRRFHLAAHGQHAARDIVRRTAHRRFPVKPVSLAAAATPRRSPSPADHPRAPVLAERAHRDAQTAGHRTAAQSLRQQRFRFPNPRCIQHNPAATPAPLPEPRLALLPVTPYRSGHRRKRNAERSRNVLLTDAAQKMKPRHSHLRRAGILRRMAVDRNQIGKIRRPARNGLHGQVAADQRGFRRRHRKAGRHGSTLLLVKHFSASGAPLQPPTSANYRLHKRPGEASPCPDV